MRLGSPLREYLRTETGGASVLLAAALAALVWANVSSSTYSSFWATEFALRIGDHAISEDLRHWVNDGLMAFFFFVIGLEARREFDLGELRDRHRLPVPALAALAYMGLPVLIYLAINGGKSSADGWGVAMSTDTAFVLGLLAVIGPRLSTRLRAFIVTVVVVDDLIALGVIAVAYSGDLDLSALMVAIALFSLVFVCRAADVRHGAVYAVIGIAVWIAMRASGIDPVIVGLAMGLLTYAYPATREDLERASSLFREFREQPTPELARSARRSLELAISPNDRLAQRFHPWSSYVIVPLFALANAGITVDGDLARKAVTSPITLGIVAAYTVGKPLGMMIGAAVAERATLGRAKPPVGRGALLGAGAAAGIGFTVSLLIASRAFTGDQLDEAKLGILAAAALSALISWAIFKLINRLPYKRRLKLLVGRSEELIDLAQDVDPDEDHVRGPEDAPVTVVEYADFECPYCGRAEPTIRELLSSLGDEVRYVFRHLPLNDVHPHAQMAAEATEAAHAQGRFWEMHDLLFDHQGDLRARDLVRYAEQLELDVERFNNEIRSHEHAGRVARDVESAELSGVSGTPTFFINGQRHHGAYDIRTLSAAVRSARARRLVATPQP